MDLKLQFRQYLGNIILFIADLASLLFIFFIVVLLRIKLSDFSHAIPALSTQYDQFWWFLPVWLGIMFYEGAYSKKFTFWDEVKFLWKSTFLATITIVTILFISKQSILYPRTLILTMAAMSFFVFPFLRVNIKKILHYFGLRKRRILILGAGHNGRLAYSALKNEPNLGYDPVAFIDDIPKGVNKLNGSGLKTHRGIDRIGRYLKSCDIHDVIIAKSNISKEKLTETINIIQHVANNTLYMPDITGIAVLGTELRHFFDEQALVLEIKNNLANPLTYFAKRLLDYLTGLVLFLIFLLPFVVISGLIKSTSKGPIFFYHKRVGKNGELFQCIKFRTMYQDAQEKLQVILNSNSEAKKEWDKYHKLTSDPRITFIGKFLRETSLDELPQLLNVLKGDMSLVGPRPVTKEEIDNHYKDNADFCFSVPPGITGLWQVSGRSNSTYTNRISLDIWYVRNWKVWLDVIILFKTVRVVLKKEGAS